MTTATTVHTSTFLQRGRIRDALRGAGLPVERVTDQHRTLLVSAGIRAEYGAHIPTLLRGVSSAAASRLLTAIRQIEVT